MESKKKKKVSNATLHLFNFNSSYFNSSLNPTTNFLPKKSPFPHLSHYSLVIVDFPLQTLPYRNTPQTFRIPPSTQTHDSVLPQTNNENRRSPVHHHQQTFPVATKEITTCERRIPYLFAPRKLFLRQLLSQINTSEAAVVFSHHYETPHTPSLRNGKRRRCSYNHQLVGL